MNEDITTWVDPAGPLGKEPVLILLGSAAAVADLGLIVAHQFDWLDITAEQITAVVAFVTAVSGVAAALIRASVYAPATVHSAPLEPPIEDIPPPITEPFDPPGGSTE